MYRLNNIAENMYVINNVFLYNITFIHFLTRNIDINSENIFVNVF